MRHKLAWLLLVIFALVLLLGGAAVRADPPPTYKVALPLVYNRYEPDPMCWIMDR